MELDKNITINELSIAPGTVKNGYVVLLGQPGQQYGVNTSQLLISMTGKGVLGVDTSTLTLRRGAFIFADTAKIGNYVSGVCTLDGGDVFLSTPLLMLGNGSYDGKLVIQNGASATTDEAQVGVGPSDSDAPPRVPASSR